jgi:hypothetical protein
LITGQGYIIGKIVIIGHNLSCIITLVKRGGPGPERSRHINIYHFWVAERIDEVDVVIKGQLGTTKMMFANSLTTLVYGAHFKRERRARANNELGPTN